GAYSLSLHDALPSYKAQLCLYAAGFEAEGKTVKRVALIAYPATESSLDGLYVWEMPYDDEARALVQEVKEATERRKTMASLVQRSEEHTSELQSREK